MALRNLVKDMRTWVVLQRTLDVWTAKGHASTEEGMEGGDTASKLVRKAILQVTSGPSEGANSYTCDVEQTRCLVRGLLIVRAVYFCDRFVRAYLADEIEAHPAVAPIEPFAALLMERLLQAIPFVADHFVVTLIASGISPFPELLKRDEDAQASFIGGGLIGAPLSSNVKLLQQKVRARKSVQRQLGDHNEETNTPVLRDLNF